MNPHKLTVQIFLFLVVVFSSVENSFSKGPTGGRHAVVVDERLAALRRTPELNGALVRRLGRGRLVVIRGSRTTADGVVFFLVNVTTRTRGWIQREAVVTSGRAGDDQRLLDLIKASQGFDQIVRARLFLDHFPRSPFRPEVLLLLGNTAESLASELSGDAAKRLVALTTNSGFAANAPAFTYFLNYTGLDRYNRQRITFLFSHSTKRFHYDGAAWRELLRRYPNSPEAPAARKRLAQLGQADP
jgi:hypothetical protein